MTTTQQIAESHFTNRAEISENFIVLNITPSEEEEKKQESHYEWWFQRISDSGQRLITKISNHISESIIRLTLAYSLLFIVSIGRIILQLYTVKWQADKITNEDKVIVWAETSLSALWLLYSIYQYISKLRTGYDENSRAGSFAFILFCVQYFTLSFWVLETIVADTPHIYGILEVILYVLYGFISEQSPFTTLIIVFLTLVAFIVEILVRFVTCHCSTICLESEKVKSVKRQIPIVSYSAEKHPQNRCGVCLLNFKEMEKVVQLNCHPSHVFHAECMKEWINTHYFCPFCRKPITKKTVDSS